MKLIVITFFAWIGSSHFVTAQSVKLQSGDSVRIELERNALSKELIQLRDSMSITLLAFDAKIVKALPSKVKKLEAARKELSTYQDQVELDLEEVIATSQNAWSDSARERIRLYANNTRKEYKRIRLML